MEDRQRLVRVVVNADPGFDVVVAMLILGDLQGEVFEAHGVVVADNTVFLNAQHIGEVPGERHKGRTRLTRLNSEAGIVRGDEGLLEEQAGLIHVGNSGKAQFLGQAFLQGSEHPLRAPPSLRRIGRDQLDAKLDQGATDLGRIIPINLAARLGRMPVVRATIRIKRTKQPLFRDYLLKSGERTHGAFLINKYGRINLAARIVHGDD